MFLVSNFSRVEWAHYKDLVSPVILKYQLANNHKFAKQIFRAMEDERAFLFCDDFGFCILEPLPDLSLNIMFAFSGAENAIDKYQIEIEKLARVIGCKTVQLTTKIDKLTETLNRHGYALVTNNDGMLVFKKGI